MSATNREEKTWELWRHRDNTEVKYWVESDSSGPLTYLERISNAPPPEGDENGLVRAVRLRAYEDPPDRDYEPTGNRAPNAGYFPKDSFLKLYEKVQ